MKKEKFLKLKINTIKCRDCERNLDIKNFAYNTIHEDNTGICRSCQWIKLHNDKIEELKKEYSENLIIDLIRYIYESDEADLRYFANLYRVDIKTIIDINSFLKIGNKKIIVKDICEYCINYIKNGGHKIFVLIDENKIHYKNKYIDFAEIT